MAGNGAGSSSGGGGASISAAAAAIGLADARLPAQERRSRWGGIFSCFGSQKGNKRVVPASRVSDGNISTSRGTGSQSAGPPNQNTNLNLSILAPPSSPASFTNSALPSTAQSPSCFMSMSANSPGGPTSTMFMTGPYAHETQLVSPPVFSTFTTEPSTAPLTPPPELAHLTTPSSPDVPYAQYLSSSLELKGSNKHNSMPFLSSGYSVGSDLQATYPLYPGSPSSSLISPASATPRTGLSSPFPEQEVPSQWGTSRDSPYSRSGSKLFGFDSSSSRNFMSTDSSFFRPATSAQFYLDQAQQSFPSYSQSAGKLSISREADSYSNVANRHNKACKQDVEEIEAYRASFGFSADEIISTQHYVEISEAADDSFTMSPFGNNKPCIDPFPVTELTIGGQTIGAIHTKTQKAMSDESGSGGHNEGMHSSNNHADSRQKCPSDGSFPSLKGGEERLSKSLRRQLSKRFLSGQSCSDAEVEYRRARSLKDTHSRLAWRTSPS
ncbi:uncharacterized protein A4U43_C01F33660 [Asparagus officinalis]|uniref:Uncharacterized protein n=1 Tax=Asparagus officinalis TaxID=4686 RepID=A0A5P1FU48_ASPOF|nr:uncharacterized protein At1g76660 [Asparagus officinalis]ONK81865.1 uncharacterized protein A4U43_C01F33660 [Asparagus officinalis]